MENRLFSEHNSQNPKKHSHIIGLGLDNNDGHKRMTRADRFSVLGGSEETHDKITATLLKTFEQLDRKGKALEQTEPEELSDIINESASEL